ncbi:MAG: hypothetical protein ACTSVZ_09815, partial [Promethearchaeota archaeon]
MRIQSESKKNQQVIVAGICLLLLVSQLNFAQSLSTTVHPTKFSEDWTLKVGSNSVEYVLEVEEIETTGGVISMGIVTPESDNEYYIIRVAPNGSLMWSYEHLGVEDSFLSGLFVDEINNRTFSLISERNESVDYTLYLLILDLTDGSELLKMHLKNETVSNIGKFAINPDNSSQIFIGYTHHYNSYVIACDISTETIYWQREITPVSFKVEIVSLHYSGSNGKLYFGLQDQTDGLYIESYYSSRLISMRPGSTELGTLETLYFEGLGCLGLLGFQMIDDILYVLGLREDIDDVFTFALKIMELDFSETN